MIIIINTMLYCSCFCCCCVATAAAAAVCDHPAFEISFTHFVRHCEKKNVCGNFVTSLFS